MKKKTDKQARASFKPTLEELNTRRHERAQQDRAKRTEEEAHRRALHTQELAKDNPFKETPLQELAEALRSIHAQVKRQTIRPDFAAAQAGRYLDAAIEKGFMAGDLAFRGNHIESKLRSWNLALGNAIAYLRNEGKISEDVPKVCGYYEVNSLPALADLIERDEAAYDSTPNKPIPMELWEKNREVRIGKSTLVLKPAAFAFLWELAHKKKVSTQEPGAYDRMQDWKDAFEEAKPPVDITTIILAPGDKHYYLADHVNPIPHTENPLL